MTTLVADPSPRAFALGVLALFALSGCVHLEQFSTRATEFNVQVADAQNKTLLLNIVRAANRFPMHFTELSTLSGTGTLTEGGTLTAPVGILNGGMGTGSAAPTFSLTETPTFNVAVLETQEFYKGMLGPLSLDQIATYVDEGLQPELVYTLAFGELLYQDAPEARRLKFENNFHPVGDDKKGLCPRELMDKDDDHKPKYSEYDCFRAIERALIDKGLTVEKVKTVVNVGPLFTQETLNDLQWLRGLDPKVFTITSVDADACAETRVDKETKETKPQALADSCPEGLEGLPEDQQKKLASKQRLFRVQTEKAEYRYCFDTRYESHNAAYTWVDLPDRIRHAHVPSDLICRNRLPKRFKDPGENKGKSNAAVAHSVMLSDSSKGTDAFTLQVEPRSTEGVVYYLGEIMRCETGLDSLSVCSTPSIAVNYRDGSPHEETLFAVTAGEMRSPSLNEWDDGHISVNWGGKRYAVTMDPQAADRSGQVLRVVTQLLALNRSAKDFPTPAIVPIISH